VRDRNRTALGGWLLLRDNAPVHSSTRVTRLFDPEVGPDDSTTSLTRQTIFYSLRRKIATKLKRFEDVKAIQWNVTRALKAIPEKEFSGSSKRLHERNEICIERGEDYVEN